MRWIGWICVVVMMCGCASKSATPREKRERATSGPTTRPTKPVSAREGAKAQASGEGFEVHDRRRPQPKVVDPGTSSTQERAGTPPSDAVVLFDGKDLSKWQSDKGGSAPWKVENGEMVIAPHSGAIVTTDKFRDVQMHAEWMEPVGITGRSQGRGNSGIFLMGLYEIQVLDNYNSETYADGMAGSIYGQFPPLVNVCRPQGQWQTYDVVFHAPVYRDGKVIRPATETVFLNGVLVQDNAHLIGPTKHQQLTSYPAEHPERGPIQLQDHGNPIRFRNIWVREIPSGADKPKPPTTSAGENYYEKKQPPH